VATGSDYRDAAPVTGISFGAMDEVLRVAVAVAPHVADSQQQHQTSQ
jgi:hypothetical protein